MGMCKNCKHWDTEYATPDYGGACDLTYANPMPDDPPSRARASENSAGFGILFTASDFGCVQFSPRNPRKPFIDPRHVHPPRGETKGL